MIRPPKVTKAENGAKPAGPASVQRTAMGSGMSGRIKSAQTTNAAASSTGNTNANRSALASTESLIIPIPPTLLRAGAA